MLSHLHHTQHAMPRDEPSAPARKAPSGLVVDDLVRMRRVRDLIDRDHARPLYVAALARAVHVSPSLLARRYREVYGETPHQHLLARRIERARHLLATTPLTVAEVCREVGFASLGSFTTTFTRLVGTTPAAARGATRPDGVPPCHARHLERRTTARASDRAGTEKPRRRSPS